MREDDQETLRDELRAKFPRRSSRAEVGPRDAIRMFCTECMGGNLNDARDCQLATCFLHPFRPGTKARKGVGATPPHDWPPNSPQARETALDPPSTSDLRQGKGAP